MDLKDLQTYTKELCKAYQVKEKDNEIIISSRLDNIVIDKIHGFVKSSENSNQKIVQLALNYAFMNLNN